MEKINDLNYIVVPATGRKKSPDRVHVSSLKPFHTRLPSSAVGNCAEGQATPATRAVNKLKASQVAGPQHPRRSGRVGAERRAQGRAQSAEYKKSTERRAQSKTQSAELARNHNQTQGKNNHGVPVTEGNSPAAHQQKEIAENKRPVRTLSSTLSRSRRHLLRPRNTLKHPDFFHS